MIYLAEKNKIIVKDLTQFNIKHILECGQVFRYNKIYENDKEICYQIISGTYEAKVVQNEQEAIIYTRDVNYFINYFDLKTDYNEIKRKLLAYPVMKKAIEFGYGIRILKQQPLETIISFIISANNNIKRIQFSLNEMCENICEKINGYYSFPSLQALNNLTTKNFANFKVGYRANYLVETIKTLNNVDLQSYYKLDEQKLTEKLTSLKGIGQKVADCIMLFAFSKMTVFPVDTWIEKVYNAYFAKEKESNRKIIRQNLTKLFGNLSGYAQQYLFYYKREMDKKF